MKARLTAVLSLTGVLVAGTAAAVVNTQVLQSSSSDQADLLGDGSVPSTVVDTSTVVTPPDSSVDTTVPPPTQAAYQIGDAGVVVLDTAGDTLTIVSATPAAGWLLVEAEQKDPLNVEVKLRTGTTTVEFKANLLFGVVSTSVESKDGDEGSVTSLDDDDDHSGSGHDGSDDDHSGPGGGGSDDD